MGAFCKGVFWGVGAVMPDEAEEGVMGTLDDIDGGDGGWFGAKKEIKRQKNKSWAPTVMGPGAVRRVVIR